MKRVFPVLIAAVLFLLTACSGGPEPSVSASLSPTASPKSPEPSPSDVLEEDYTYTAIDEVIDKAASIINASRRDDLSTDTFDYEQTLVYDSLDAEDRTLYDEILIKVKAVEPFSYEAEAVGYDVLDRVISVFGSINLDYPELENYFVIREVMEGDMTSALEPCYFLPWDSSQTPADPGELQEEIERFDKICDRIVARMPEDLSAYDRYRYLATVISLVTSYDYDCFGGWQVGTAYGSIVGGYSICQGYSRGFMYLCSKANLWCVCIEGIVGDASHMWNMVKIDSGSYHVDVTWSDELGTPGSDEWMRYFMLTEEEILADHGIIGEVVEMRQ